MKTTKKVYMTKKRKAKIAMKKTIVILLAIMTGAGVIGFTGQQTLNSLEVTEIAHAQVSVTQPVAPKIKPQTVVSESIREITAYNAGVAAQTDSSPCIAANGENICEALDSGFKRCAANFVPFGTKLSIDHYGDCIVTDRMNSRFKNRVDIAMSADEVDRAIKFGLQKLNVKILK